MPTTRATRDTRARTVDEQFLDLICSDEDLLRAEFDAIIAAEWSSPPTTTPRHAAAHQRPTNDAPRGAAARIASPVTRPRHPGIGG